MKCWPQKSDYIAHVATCHFSQSHNSSGGEKQCRKVESLWVPRAQLMSYRTRTHVGDPASLTYTVVAWTLWKIKKCGLSVAYNLFWLRVNDTALATDAGSRRRERGGGRWHYRRQVQRHGHLGSTLIVVIFLTWFVFNLREGGNF